MARLLALAAASLAVAAFAAAVVAEEHPASVPLDFGDHSCAVSGGAGCTEESLSLRQLRATAATANTVSAQEEKAAQVNEAGAVTAQEASGDESGDDRGGYFQIEVAFHVKAHPGQLSAKHYRQKSWVTSHDTIGHAIRLAAQMQQNAQGYAWKNIYIEWNGVKRYQHVNQYQSLGSLGINPGSIRTASIYVVAEN